MLMKPHEEIIAPVGHYFNLEMELKFNETSQVTFNYPKYSDGKSTPLYDELIGDRLIQIDPFGIFIVAEVEEQAEGRECVKEVTAYSREYELGAKQAIFAEGVYNFWNPADVENTLLGMVVRCTRNWKIGSVSSSLIGRHRTFDSVTDVKILDFLLNTVQETFGCVFVFDTYHRVINVVDADEATVMVPVYLSAQNLIKECSMSETTDNMFTKLYVQGADDVTIMNVNPAGDSYLYNLDYYISKGELPAELAAKWLDWQNEIFTNQPYYTSLVALRNSAGARYLTEKARLTDMQNQLCTLDNTRATFLQMQMSAINDDTYQYFEERLADTGVEYTAIEADVAEQKALLEEIQAEYQEHAANIAAVNDKLRLNAYFTSDELDILEHYFKEDTFADSTFAVFDVDIEGNEDFSTSGTAAVQFINVTWTDVPCEGGHRMAAIVGGSVSLTGTNSTLYANIISGTLDHRDGEVICSLYLGSGTANGETFPSGNLTCVCSSSYDDDALLNGMEKHEDTITSSDGTVSHTTYYYTGSVTIAAVDAAFYFTRNVTEYQRYSVEQELYDYASECIKDIAMPTYEFEVQSGNLLWAKEFEAFKNAIQLGCGVYLQVNDDLMLEPLLLEIHLDFENPDDFSLVFSNRFKRPDAVNSMKEILTEATTASRTLDLNKYAFASGKNTTLWVQNLLENGYSAAMAQIMAGQNKQVTIDQAGIKIYSDDGVDAIMMNDGMIALVDRRTNTAKMAMGHFYNEATGTDFVGILADIIGGTLLAGQNLIIECPDPNGGVMQFKVDSSGVIINNGRMYMRTAKGAMGWDANYGFFAGVQDLFDTTETGYVYPVCVDEDGGLILDDSGFPQGVNVWIGIDGKVYVRGNIYAEDGVFTGTVYAKDGVFNGTVYATGGEFTGKVTATSGVFKGVVQASSYLDSSGKSMMTNDQWNPEYLNLKGLNINNNFIVDENGRVTINNGSISWGAVTGTDSLYSDINAAQTAAGNAQSTANTAYNTAYNAANTASSAYSLASSANSTVSGWRYGGTTYIDGTMLMTGTVKASSLQAGSVALLGSSGLTAGSMTLTGASSYAGQKVVLNSGAIEISASYGDVYIRSGSGPYLQLSSSGVIAGAGDLISNGNGSYACGDSSHKWSAVYASSGTIQTSDRHAKHDIEELPDKYLQMLLELSVYRFKLNDGTSDRYHVGYIAQDVEEYMSKYDIDSSEFGGFVRAKDEDGNDIYMLRYEEFIAIHTLAAQKQEKEISDLKAIVNQQGAELDELKRRLEAAGL